MLSPLRIRARRQAASDYDAVGREGSRDLIESLQTEAQAERERAQEAARRAEQLRAVGRAAGSLVTDEKGFGLCVSVHKGVDPLEVSRTERYRHVATDRDSDRFEDQPDGWDVGLWMDDRWGWTPEYDDPSLGLPDAFARWMREHAASAWNQCAEGHGAPVPMIDIGRLATRMAGFESDRSDELSESASWCEARSEALRWRLLNPSAEVPELLPGSGTDEVIQAPAPAEKTNALRIANALVTAAEGGELAPGSALVTSGTWTVGDLFTFVKGREGCSETTARKAFKYTGVFDERNGGDNGKGTRGHDLAGRLGRLLDLLAAESEEHQARVDEVRNVVLALAPDHHDPGPATEKAD